MAESVLLLVFSITVLYFGAELTLNASEKVGAKLGLSPLLIGMLLIGFGTSLPEFFVAHIAGSQNKMGIAIGSLVGSNIANMFLILGVSGLIAKLSVFTKGVRKHLAVHLLLSAVLFFVLTRPTLNLISSLPLLFVIGVYLYIIKMDLGEEVEQEEAVEVPREKPAILFIKLIAGFGLLYVGGEYLVVSGTKLCLALGFSEYIVSAIFIAFGTSFPELVTALLAAVKKKDTDLIVGNIVGSNIFNCGFILGTLGIYNFTLDVSFQLELISILLGALVLFAYSYKEKFFYKKTSVFFLLCYGFVVFKWLENS
ncbi:MAG: hypothetical protein CME62_17550 [Halobacteriovoraceae bacterium]|nr:hypothetical protein [Halobacteriovoraceae bacterium]|tara:strand:+ start:32404 stop:33336 length:933 start_codon:yes stop_codon:yes gene_type:complete